MDATKDPELADLYAVLEAEPLDDPQFVADRRLFAQFVSDIRLTLCFALRSVAHVPLVPSPAQTPDAESTTSTTSAEKKVRSSVPLCVTVLDT